MAAGELRGVVGHGEQVPGRIGGIREVFGVGGKRLNL